MKIVAPIAITDAMLISSTVAENDYAAWNAATAYVVGDRVIRTTTHRIYERLVNGTTATAPESDPTNWIEVQATNRWAMFDTVVSTQTTNSGSIVVEIQPGRADTIALLDVVANEVTVEMSTATEGVVYTHTATMSARETETVTWSGYFFGRFEIENTLTLTDLPINGTGVITVTIDAGGGTAECGTLVAGLMREYGDLQFGVRPGIIDYSRKETDTFGNTTFVQRSFAKRFEGRLIVPNTQIDALYKLLAALRATPVLWIGADGYEMLVVFGWYRDFAVDLAYPTESYCSLTIEGLA